jgi:hypothetical protein
MSAADVEVDVDVDVDVVVDGDGDGDGDVNGPSPPPSPFTSPSTTTSTITSTPESQAGHAGRERPPSVAPALGLPGEVVVEATGAGAPLLHEAAVRMRNAASFTRCAAMPATVLGTIRSYRMSKSAKIAFSLDARLLDRVERVRARTGESRSALIARALVAVTEEEARRQDILQYVEAYRRQPETPAEVTMARASARRTLERLPWDGS